MAQQNTFPVIREIDHHGINALFASRKMVSDDILGSIRLLQSLVGWSGTLDALTDD
jgi:hypothetical protein